MDIQEVEEFFGISAKAWKKMEIGAVIQSRSVDNYLRLMGDENAEPSKVCNGMKTRFSRDYDARDEI